jgi:hypothetical protein
MDVQTNQPYCPDSQNHRPDKQEHHLDVPKHTVLTLHTKNLKKRKEKKAEKYFPSNF